MNYIFCPSYCKMYGKEPRYNATWFWWTYLASPQSRFDCSHPGRFFKYHFLIDFFAALKPPYKLFFRVKFYSVDPSTLHEEITRWPLYIELLVPQVTNIQSLLKKSIYHQGKRSWELINWSSKGKCFDLLSNSLDWFLRENISIWGSVWEMDNGA